MLADYNFYIINYKGIIIADAHSFDYYGARASDELALFSNRAVFSRDKKAKEALQKCACRIADILFEQSGSKKDGKNITSENIAGYYSATYASVNDADVKKQINGAIRTYLGRYVLGGARAIL